MKIQLVTSRLKKASGIGYRTTVNVVHCRILNPYRFGAVQSVECFGRPEIMVCETAYTRDAQFAIWPQGSDQNNVALSSPGRFGPAIYPETDRLCFNDFRFDHRSPRNGLAIGNNSDHARASKRMPLSDTSNRARPDSVCTKLNRKNTAVDAIKNPISRVLSRSEIPALRSSQQIIGNN